MCQESRLWCVACVAVVVGHPCCLRGHQKVFVFPAVVLQCEVLFVVHALRVLKCLEIQYHPLLCVVSRQHTRRTQHTQTHAHTHTHTHRHMHASTQAHRAQHALDNPAHVRTYTLGRSAETETHARAHTHTTRTPC